AAYDDSYGPLQHPKISLIQSSSNEPFQASHNPPCLEHLVNGLDHGRCSVLITFSPDCSIRFPSLQIRPMLVAMPFHNLEICDNNDPPFGVYIENRFSVNSEAVELLTFPPVVRDSPKGVLVIVYRLMLVHDPFISSKVGPVRSSGVSVSTLSRFIMKLEKSKGVRSCSNHDPELEVSSVEKTIQNAEKIELRVDHLHLFQTPNMKDLDPVVELPALLVAISNGALANLGSLPSLHLLDPRSNPAEGLFS
nr:hypothetical protein [Tanacetum cinerariifolium]